MRDTTQQVTSGLSQRFGKDDADGPPDDPAEDVADGAEDHDGHEAPVLGRGPTGTE